MCLADEAFGFAKCTLSPLQLCASLESVAKDEKIAFIFDDRS